MDYTLFKDFAGPVATVLAALTAAGIAVGIGLSQLAIGRLQARAANDKIVLDLFERRLNVYSQVRAVIRKILTQGKVQPTESFDFLAAMDGASFLFGAEVTDYLRTLYEAILDVENAEHEEEAAKTSEERRNALERRRLHRSTLEDFYKRAPQLLAPYVSAHQRFTTT
jgi:hypothetical protein